MYIWLTCLSLVKTQRSLNNAKRKLISTTNGQFLRTHINGIGIINNHCNICDYSKKKINSQFHLIWFYHAALAEPVFDIHFLLMYLMVRYIFIKFISFRCL